MSDTRIERLRRLGAHYWKPVLSIGAAIPAALNTLKISGLPIGDLPSIGATPLIKWLTIGIGIFVIAIIRFPRVALVITRLIVGPPPPPASTERVFRGLKPYFNGDKLPGRPKDIEHCLEFIKHHSFFVLDGESGCRQVFLAKC
jgi:hypothetical protein